MLGAAGALCCLMAGTALGSWLRERRITRFQMLRAETEMLGGMRLMLEQERLSIPELLTISATYASNGSGAQEAARRFMLASEALVREPLVGLPAAYAQACARISAPWEQTEERSAMEQLFSQLGTGTAAMREQAVSACLRRLKPLVESSRVEAENGGRMCMQLGMLLGLMAGIILW